MDCGKCEHAEKWGDGECKMWQDCDGYWESSMGDDL